MTNVGCNLIQEIEATTTIYSLHVEKNGWTGNWHAGPRNLQGIMNILREMMNNRYWWEYYSYQILTMFQLFCWSYLGNACILDHIKLCWSDVDWIRAEFQFNCLLFIFFFFAWDCYTQSYHILQRGDICDQLYLLVYTDGIQVCPLKYIVNSSLLVYFFYKDKSITAAVHTPYSWHWSTSEVTKLN